MIAAGPAATVAPQCRNVDKPAVTGSQADPAPRTEQDEKRGYPHPKGDIMFAERDTPAYKEGLETVLVEILPHRTVKRSIFVLNTYSPPSDKKRDFNRLLISAAEHRILRDAGIRPIFQPEEKAKLTNDVRKHIKVQEIPRNIHPTLNEGRRRDRGRVLINNAKKHKTHALFVDAARYNGRQAFAVAVVDIDGTLINAVTVQTGHAHEAEKMAIALALENSRADSKVYPDSKMAARTFAASLLATSTTKLTDNAIREYDSKETLIEEENVQIHMSWFPAHMGQISGLGHCNPNEEVNRLVRKLPHRAADNDAYKG
ncbi:hypothetical protein HPB50_004188 [Hyalomma asiaticum]|uniref:Uncharacterized protein n=1 Tax=Hyalomma asiaticum TaxID=266040 RepID=A0ACB7RYA8_HYAAI|nr:hypothetical protein HPB50_004188 [Hyalomma asiaticum]